MSDAAARSRPLSAAVPLSANQPDLTPVQELDNSDGTSAPEIQEVQYLQVQPSPELPFLLFPVPKVAELMKLSLDQVIPMFQMPPWVMGVHNWRGEILWIADLSHFFGLPPWYEQAKRAAKHTLVVIQPDKADSSSKALGLVVNQVADIVVYPEVNVQPVPETIAIAPGVRPFLKASCTNDLGQLDWILDSKAILTSMAGTHN